MNAQLQTTDHGTIEPGLTFAEYRARDGLSITTLKEMLRSPLHFRHARDNPKDSAPFALGRAAHCAVLEPHRFGIDFAVWDRRTASGAMAPRNGKQWEEFQDGAYGRDIITADQAALALDMAISVHRDRQAMKYLRTGLPEVSMFWRNGPFQCRGRIDWLHESRDLGTVLVGLKSTQDCRPFHFSRQAKRLGYELQWAYYHDGWQTITGRAPDRVVEIVVEAKPPHAVGVYVIPGEVLQAGTEQYLALLEQLDECQRTDFWPGPNRTEQILTLPTWGDAEQIEGIEYVD